MAKFLRSFLALAALAVSFIGTSVYLDANSFETPRSFVHFIHNDDNGGTIVMVAPGLAITAAHVATISDLLVNGAPVKVLDMDQDKDIALLAVAEDCPCAPLYGSLELDKEVVAVGYTLGITQFVTEGHNMNFWKGKLVNTAPIGPGNSGGGLFSFTNGRWQLTGLTVAGATIPYNPFMGGPFGIVQSIAFAVPADQVREFLRENGFDLPGK